MNNETLEKHFDLAFSAPNGVQKLRELILTFAMQGKLVPQDPNDQPASELLKEIELEKQRFIKEGKIKQPKPLSEITSEEMPYELPATWKWVRFDHIAENSKNALKAGPFGSALKKSMYVPTGFKIYGQEQVISGDEKFGDYFIDNAKYSSLESCAIKSGDILISLVGTIGRVLVLSDSCQPGIINPRLVKISLYKGISREFIKHLLNSSLIQMELSERSHGGTMNILNLGLLESDQNFV
jgi:type I restriction enzyme, S subunit